MELILTESEKAAATWLELDDESVGKLVKATMFKIKQFSDESEKIYLWSAALMLCSAVAETNAGKYEQTIEGLTVHDKPYGNWKLIITKK